MKFENILIFIKTETQCIKKNVCAVDEAFFRDKLIAPDVLYEQIRKSQTNALNFQVGKPVFSHLSFLLLSNLMLMSLSGQIQQKVRR